MAHCTLPWRGTGERKTLFYKYTSRKRPSHFTRDYSTTASLPYTLSLLLPVPSGDEDPEDQQLADGVRGRRFPANLPARL